MKLKKLLATGLAAIMVMGLVGCSSSKGSSSSASSDASSSAAKTEKLQQIKDAGVLKVGTSAEYSPYEFHKVVDGEDKIVGFDDFVVQEIAKDMGVKVEYEDMDFDGLLGALQADKVDIVLAGMTPDEKRKKSVDFSDIYYTNSNVCIVTKGKEDTIKKSEDLKDLKVGVQKGTTQADYVTNTLGISDATQLKKIPDLMLELQNGKIDVIVTGKAVAEINVKKYDNIAIGNTTVGDEVAETAAAAIKKSGNGVDNTSFVKSVNDTIKRLQDSGDMDKYMQEALKLAE
ncbi:transporter substrate-binding domain-containing protein [Intestinibacter bartlettii]|uniref:Transporter substrate-binding domain-containing protein n=1 Tax=Intestinibacter bartlettii TaxID=261299 RepID=A0ABS8D2G4_9FIRM|nr:transporter substrate-binding domain-containing protein [Intestinibacter bartlettii]MCB5398525.1 transporter substrate-binding domain-containing protein [Intestinibacter bartlettii]MCB5405121.1 transporter substrate-binding domain-containing protein [Intestinibacter bartlettii]MCB5447352.1 transporter substrate-binding domain-containing protein [Intestinibacter bartlettii]MCB5721790.1 transporter substrate-binding domain-containing protein [Intestinibacter bartlettii]MCB5750141.1 transporte